MFRYWMSKPWSRISFTKLVMMRAASLKMFTCSMLTSWQEWLDCVQSGPCSVPAVGAGLLPGARSPGAQNAQAKTDLGDCGAQVGMHACQLHQGLLLDFIQKPLQKACFVFAREHTECSQSRGPDMQARDASNLPGSRPALQLRGEVQRSSCAATSRQRAGECHQIG